MSIRRTVQATLFDEDARAAFEGYVSATIAFYQGCLCFQRNDADLCGDTFDRA